MFAFMSKRVPLQKASLVFTILLLRSLPSIWCQREFFAQVRQNRILVIRERPRLEPGVPNQESFDLQSELDNAFSKGIHTLTFAVSSFVFGSELRIRRNLTITSDLPEFAKAELSCGNVTRMVNIVKVQGQATNVLFENLRITDCTASRSKGVINVGSRVSVTFSNVEISNNAAEGNNIAVVTADSGSEINILQKSSFSNNTGRVLFVEGNSTVRINESSFINNTAIGNGSVLATKSGQGMIALTIRGNSIFESNRVNNGNGGVFWLENSNLTIENGVRFTNNTAHYSGGAIWMATVAEAHFSGILFDYNRCLIGGGGALYISPTRSESNVTFQSSVFSRNGANGVLGMGGALLYGNTELDHDRMLILTSDVLFFRNSARISGGATSICSTKVNASISATFVGNVAIGNGGGLHVNSPRKNSSSNVLIYGHLTMSSFINNTAPLRGGGGVSTRGTVSLEIVKNNFTMNAGHTGGAIFSDDMKEIKILNETVFFRNVAYESGGSFTLVNGQNAEIKDSVFESNECVKRGGGIFARDEEELAISNSTFRQNHAYYSGGAINIEDSDDGRGEETRITIENVKFQNNKSPEYLHPENREGYGGAIRLAGSGVRTEVNKCNFSQNIGLFGGAMYVDKAFSTHIERTRFVNNQGRFGGAAYIVPLEKKSRDEQDSCNFANCSFSRNQGYKGGAIYARSDRLNNEDVPEPAPSLLSISNSDFRNNKFVSDFQTQPMTMCVLRANCSGGGLHLAGIKATVDHSLFERNSISEPGCRTSERARNGNSEQGGAIFGCYGTLVEVMESNFTENNALGKGGATSLDNAHLKCSRSCWFFKNHARIGGGVFGTISSEQISSGRTALFHCSDCSFEENTANVGGGIYSVIPDMNNIADAKPSCSMRNLGVRNESSNDSNKEDCEEFVYLQNWNSRLNEASTTGNFIFATQPFLVIVLEDNRRENLVDYFNRNKKNTVRENEYASIPCKRQATEQSFFDLNRGQTGTNMSDLDITITDCFDQNTTGTRTVVEIKACTENENCCSDFSDKEDKNFEFYTPNTKTVTNGTVNFTGLDFSDGRSGDSSYTLWACFKDHGDEPANLEPLRINISFRGCYKMEEFNKYGRGGCSECESGQYYSYIKETCTVCPKHVECKGLTIAPDEGYWHTSSISGKMHQCFPHKACAGSKKNLNENATNAHRLNATLFYNQSEYTQCRKGYEGLLCGTCSDGYGRRNLECTKCFAKWLSWFTMFSVMLGNMVVLLILVYSARTLVEKGRMNRQSRAQNERVVRTRGHRGSGNREIQLVPHRSEQQGNSPSVRCVSPVVPESGAVAYTGTVHVGSIRSVIRWRRFQEKVAAEQLPLANPLSESLKIVLNFMQVIYLSNLLNEDLPGAFRCFVIPFDGFVFAETAFLAVDCLLAGRNDRTLIRMTLQTLFPVFLILLCCLVPLIQIAFRRYRKFGLSEVRLISLCTVYLFFSPEVKTLLMFLNGDSVEDEYVELDGVPFWSLHSSEEFMSGAHAFVVGFLVIPLLIVFVIGFPLLLFSSLWGNKNSLHDEDLISSYGFLYKGYKEEYYYWELVITTRKTILAMVSVFVEDAELQAVFICIILVFFLSLQLIVSPFTSAFPRLNELEALSLAISSLVFSGANVMLRSKAADQDKLKRNVAWLLVVALALTIVVMTVELFIASHDFLNNKLVEHQLYSDKKALMSVPFIKKTFVLTTYYILKFLARFSGERNNEHSNPTV